MDSLVVARPRHFPADVLDAIAAAVYAAALPSSETPLDPLYSFNATYSSSPHASPSSFPSPHWSEPLARKTLASLCLTSQSCRDAARPWLWRRLEVNVPRNWLGILDAICGEDPPASPSEPNSIAAVLAMHGSGNEYTTEHNSRSRTKTPSTEEQQPAPPPSSIPLDLLSPPASRDPSPQRLRLRATSPGRWRFLMAVNTRVHAEDPDLYVPTPEDPSPGRHVRHLDFNHFRTIGMRRSVGDGINSRFVTESRLERLLKETPNLRAFGATEFMDSAISARVLAELILRGQPNVSTTSRSRKSFRGRNNNFDVDDSDEGEEEEAERLAASKPLEAIDFCGCISTVFVSALQSFVASNLFPSPGSNPNLSLPRTFNHLRRLGLRGVSSVPASTLTKLVLSFPHLTHLDISGTNASPALLAGLARQRGTMRLKSLALARCVRLTAASIVSLLVGHLSLDNSEHVDVVPDEEEEEGGVCDELEELSLYGDYSFPSQLREADLLQLVTQAPCFRARAINGMTYLDLSGCPVTPAVLEAMFTAQDTDNTNQKEAAPAVGADCLRTLGLSYIPDLALSPLVSFLEARAPNIEVLTLVNSCSADLSLGVGAVKGSVALRVSMGIHSRIIQPLSSLPFRIMGLSSSPAPEDVGKRPTRLRVLELAPALLQYLGRGANGTWTPIRSRGGRAWYVDASCAWINGEFCTSGEGGEPAQMVRREIERLAEAGGAGASGSVGWHAHKMEILHGLGLLGREDGLYGAVSFAYSSG